MAGSIGYVVSEMNVCSPTRFGENVHSGGWGVYGLQEALRHLGVSAEAVDDQTLDGDADLGRFRLLIPPDMMKSIEQAGLLWDSSWFDHQELATMCGVYHPFHPFDPDAKQAMNILALPAFFTDGMQWWDMYGLTPPMGYEALAERMERMRWLNGVWVTGFHSNYAPERADNLRLIVTLAREKNAWIVPAGELTDWWLLREGVHLETEREGDTRVVTVKTGEGVRAFPGVTITLNGLPPGDAQVKLNGETVQAAFRESPCHWPRHFVRLDDAKPEQVIKYDVTRGET